jgi:hypothetical protein
MSGWKEEEKEEEREWDEHVTIMDAESLVKISRDNILPEDVRKEDGAT